MPARGKQVAAWVDKRFGGTSIRNADVWKWGDAEKAIDLWADLFATRFVGLQEGKISWAMREVALRPPIGQFRRAGRSGAAGIPGAHLKPVPHPNGSWRLGFDVRVAYWQNLTLASSPPGKFVVVRSR